MRYLVSVLLLIELCALRLHAIDAKEPPFNFRFIGPVTFEQYTEATNRESRSNRYSSYTFNLESTGTFIVQITTNICIKEPLSEFVGSGKFCEVRGGHSWNIKKTHFDYEKIKSEYWCVICHKMRKFNNDLMDWDE